jgi:hypothetical protein
MDYLITYILHEEHNIIVELNTRSLDEVRRIKSESEKELLKIPEVTGVDVGLTSSNDEKTAVIRIYVKDRKNVKKKLPRKIQGIPVEVIQRTFTLH